MSAASPPIVLPDSPYRGLGEFRFADRFIFFGRHEETAKLLRTITIYRGVLFYGDSGTGKSSLINAGLVPELLKQDFAPERLRVQPRLGEEIVVERFVESDGKQIIFLPSRLVTDNVVPRLVVSTEELEQRLGALKPSPLPLLIFDQFEELVTLAEESARSTIGGEAYSAQGRTIGLIVRLLRDPTFQGKLLFVFREDYLAKLAPLFARAPELTDQFVRLTPLSNKYLRSVIRGPFELPGSNWNPTISETLADQLASSIQSRGDLSINLSEVQVACLQLWLSPNPEELYAKRRVEGLLEDFLEQSLAHMKDLADPAVALLSRMVTASGTRNVISDGDAIQAVVQEDRLPTERVEKALTALVADTRLVSRELRHNTYFYEIVSEFLVPWISRQKIKRQERLAHRKFIKRIFAGLSIFIVICGVGAYLWFQWVRYTNTVKARESVLVQNAERQVRSLQDQIATQRIEDVDRLQDANTNVARLNNDLAIARKGAADLQIDNSKLVGQLASLRQDQQGLETKLQAAEHDRTEYLSRVNAFDADAARIRAEMDAKTVDADLAHLRAYFLGSYVLYKSDGSLVKTHVERPIYPPIAKAARIQGTVTLLISISQDGTVKEMTYLSGPIMLIQATKDAVSKWTYEPIEINGKPTEVMTIIKVNFTLG